MDLNDPTEVVADVCAATVEWVCGPVRDDVQPFDDDERDHVEPMAPARRQEFLSGRAALRRALDPLGHAGAPLPAGPDRAPRLPAGVVGSLTHSGRWVVAVASERWRGIGIDLEAEQELAPSLVRRLAAPGEALSLPLVRFAAKEAVFKACSPLDGQWREFEDVALELGPSSIAVTWSRDPLPGSLDGRWASGKGWVVALVWVA